jgi:hypothetical protein
LRHRRGVAEPPWIRVHHDNDRLRAPRKTSVSLGGLGSVSDSVPEAKAGVSGPGSLLGSGLGVPVHHGTGLPAGQAHEVTLGTAGGQPRGRERVPKLVRMQPRQADRGAPLRDDLEHTRGGHGAVAADPQVRQRRVRVAGPHAQVAVERQRRLAAVGERAGAAALGAIETARQGCRKKAVSSRPARASRRYRAGPGSPACRTSPTLPRSARP